MENPAVSSSYTRGQQNTVNRADFSQQCTFTSFIHCVVVICNLAL